jgi:hypothetical protein
MTNIRSGKIRCYATTLLLSLKMTEPSIWGITMKDATSFASHVISSFSNPLHDAINGDRAFHQTEGSCDCARILFFMLDGAFKATEERFSNAFMHSPGRIFCCTVSEPLTSRTTGRDIPAGWPFSKICTIFLLESCTRIPVIPASRHCSEAWARIRNSFAFCCAISFRFGDRCLLKRHDHMRRQPPKEPKSLRRSTLPRGFSTACCSLWISSGLGSTGVCHMHTQSWLKFPLVAS